MFWNRDVVIFPINYVKLVDNCVQVSCSLLIFCLFILVIDKLLEMPVTLLIFCPVLMIDRLMEKSFNFQL